LNADAAFASAGPTACSASGQISGRREGGQPRLLQNVTIYFVLKDTQKSVVQALAALSRHELDLLFVQDDAVKQRISGAEGPIG
jgi:hypothetical protein